jgi:hypothetical protein
MGSVLFSSPDIDSSVKNKTTYGRRSGLMSSVCLARAGYLLSRTPSPKHGPRGQCYVGLADARLCHETPRAGMVEKQEIASDCKSWARQ